MNSGNEFVLCLANVESGKIDPRLRISKPGPKGIVESFWPFQNLDLVCIDIEPRGDLIELKFEACPWRCNRSTLKGCRRGGSRAKTTLWPR